jgi:hypothetical protein
MDIFRRIGTQKKKFKIQFFIGKNYNILFNRYFLYVYSFIFKKGIQYK